jgi:hypothetical protein
MKKPSANQPVKIEQRRPWRWRAVGLLIFADVAVGKIREVIDQATGLVDAVKELLKALGLG